MDEQYNEALSGGRSGDQQRDCDPGRDQFEHQIHGGEVSGLGVLDEFANKRHRLLVSDQSGLNRCLGNQSF